jgi:DNA-binding NtrC family response regulator
MNTKIFVVDDDEFFGQMLVDHLSKKPAHKVTLFFNGENCLDHLFEMPNIIILDYHLDSVNGSAADGLTVLKSIKSKLPNAHVIMLSGQNHYGLAAQTISNGAEHYIIKDNDAFNKITTIIESYK